MQSDPGFSHAKHAYVMSRDATFQKLKGLGMGVGGGVVVCE